MHTYPLADYMGHIRAGRWPDVGEMLLSSADKLHRGGAELLVCPDNTAHQGLDLVRGQSPLPWLHIAEEVAAIAVRNRFTRVLILGTKYLMDGPVYTSKLGPLGIESEVPPADIRERIDGFIFDELVAGQLNDSTRAAFREIIEDGRQRGCDAVVLGCTEIPLLIDDRDSVLPTLDSTRILARAALCAAMSTPTPTTTPTTTPP